MDLHLSRGSVVALVALVLGLRLIAALAALRR